MLLTTMIFEPHGTQIHRWAKVQDMGVLTLPQVGKACFRPERQIQTYQSPLILWNTYNYSKTNTSRPVFSQTAQDKPSSRIKYLSDIKNNKKISVPDYVSQA